MFSSSPLKRLRQRYSLETLPDAIDVPAIGEGTARTVPIEQANIDEIEFALIALGRQQSELYRLSNALSEVIRMARRQGARGRDVAIHAAVRDLEAGK
ncbi:MAG: hypothetical protein KDK10_18895 [Maritimibacter sp.]|nr:hypothetical protein [Maritimibacter sp.]